MRHWMIFATALFAGSAAPVQAESRSATPAEIELAREGMQELLKDADSAKFRNVRFGVGSSKATVCGDVNAKNTFGAYAGFTAFVGHFIGPDDYENSAAVRHAPKILIFKVDEEPDGAAAIMCATKGI